MTSLRALAMGAFIGFLAAVVPSCGAGSCNANNCAGCCTSAGKCVAKPNNQSNGTCGAQAKACVDCTLTGQTCSSATFACVGGSGGGSGGNCLGCLTSAGDCAPGVTDAVCGASGVACMPCPSGKSCVNGTCGTSSSVGAACTGDTDCGLTLTAMDQAYQIRGFCKKASLTDPSISPGFAYPGGYCVKRCGFESASCGTGNACVFNLGFIGEFENQCMQSCTGDAQCRTGYGCVPFATNLSLCFPLLGDGGAPPVADAGPGVPAEAGAACATNAGCIPPSTGFCFHESLSDGGPSGFTGGDCSADCSAVAAFTRADSWCGNGGVCNPYGFSTTDGLGPMVIWQCDRGCGVGWDAGCRSGYVCDPSSAAAAACVPDCHNAGIQCPTSTACQASGLCQ